MVEKSLISIIIPVYNSEKYLERCIESLVSQTYKNIEIILVDDGSGDNSPTICDKYQKKDSRIKVIHKRNAGPSLARKDGIKIARGEYFYFIDSDDYIDQGAFQILVKIIENNFDIVQFGYNKVTANRELISTKKLNSIEIDGSYQCALYYASQRNIVNFLWNKIFKAKLFKNVIFPKLYAGEDSCLLTQLYAFANRVINIDKPLYNYVMTPESLCRRPFSLKRLDNTEAGKFMYEFYKKYFPNFSSFSALYICSYAAKLYCELKQTNSDMLNKEDTLKNLTNDFNKYYKESKDSIARQNSSKLRIMFIELFRFNKTISFFVYNMFKKIKKSNYF